MHKQWIKDGLSEYLSDAHAVWHMPGHKRKACYGNFQDAFLAWDVTEVPGTDDLYLPEGFIGDSLAMLKEIYQTCGTYYVVNGATGGIFTAIAACTKPGDAILIAKNCHKSVYNAAAMLQRQMIYVEPTWKKEAEDAFAFTSFIDGYVDADDVERLCESHPEIAAVVVTSPTYEGVISDIAQIARVAHAHHVRVIVDEAHGAHLPFLKPEYSAIRMGADVVVQSLHKTLPAMTQTAVIHVCTEELVKPVEQALEIFLSSSPSYIFMMNMEAAICYMADHDFTEYENNLREFRENCAKLPQITMIEKEAASPSEFFLVSSVFHNRLNNKWNFPRLESDATVLYVLRHESGEKITLTADDLKYDTPYNTYMYEGLPPGPIANPSASAMLAALSPQTTNYYYFVANRGKTYFSETKAQHDAYIEEFRNETAEQQTTGDVPQN